MSGDASGTNRIVGGFQADPKQEFAAGFKLLDKFQTQWEQLHAKSESNVIKAKRALNKLDLVEKSSGRRLDALDNLITCYKSLSKLEEQIKNIDVDLKLLESCFVQIEDFLLVLKEHKEQQDTDRYVENVLSNHELQVREQKSLSDMRKERLKNDHLQRVEAFEASQQDELEERRRILEKAFEEEKIRYLERTKGV